MGVTIKPKHDFECGLCEYNTNKKWAFHIHLMTKKHKTNIRKPFVKPKYKLLDWIDEKKISWYELSKNPGVIHILEKNLDKIKWYYLSCNPAVIHLLEKNLDKIDWGQLSENPAAIHLLEKNPDKINWRSLSSNPAAIHLLEKNPDKINWEYLSQNLGGIFDAYDIPAMRKQMQPLAEELIAAVLHPRRVGRVLEEYGYNIATDEYFE